MEPILIVVPSMMTTSSFVVELPIVMVFICLGSDSDEDGFAPILIVCATVSFPILSL